MDTPNEFDVNILDPITGFWKHHSKIKRRIIEEKPKKFLYFKWTKKIYENDKEFRTYAHLYASALRLKYKTTVTLTHNTCVATETMYKVFWRNGWIA